MRYTTDPKVDSYIVSLSDWQQTICRQVRELVHAADRDVAETIKFTNRPYFVLQGNICALLAAKDHVNVFLYEGAIVPDPAGIITGESRSLHRTSRWKTCRHPDRICSGSPIGSGEAAGRGDMVRDRRRIVASWGGLYRFTIHRRGGFGF